MRSSLLFLALAIVSPLAAAPAPRPNILYFYVDDMGWGSIGPNGQAKRKAGNQPSVLTPNLDRLAAEGVNFPRAYGCTVCSPARSSQQSGFHQGHTWGDRNDPNNAKKAMRADDILMGDALSAAGYVTGYWGKWGYGGSKDEVDPVIQNIQTLPTSHGYKHVLAELHHVRAHTFFQPTLWKAPAAPGATGGLELAPNSMAAYANKDGYPKTPAMQDHAGYPKTAYCDDSYAFAALDFVRAQAQNFNATGQPFFGLLAAQIPHAPFGEVATLPDWDKAYAEDPHFASLPKQAQQWAAMVTRIDAHFGNILAALEDPDNDGDKSDSVAANTLVIFQSDNGGPGGSSNTQLDANGGLRGNKGSIYEGGIRVPTVMRWPARINASSALRAGTNSDKVIDVTDLLPTFCDLAGSETPPGLDGVSLAPTLLGSGRQRQREFLIHEAGSGKSIIRDGHKLILRTGKRGGGPKSIALYDLDADPAESKDLAGKRPQLVEELKTLLLGERVAEPDDFANTYHRWTGAHGTDACDAGNWSDYVYENDGIAYLTDKGTPRGSWTATMTNTRSRPADAIGTADLEFLSLAIRGASERARQNLVLEDGVNLTGRNEIRLAPHSHLHVNKGTVSSLRWVDVLPTAFISGIGTIDAILYNAGSVASLGTLTVTDDYLESAGSRLELNLAGGDDVPFLVDGEATLAGTLVVTLAPGFIPKKGETLKIMTAKKVNGTFANPDNQVAAAGGARFKISYKGNAVSLTAD